MTPIQPAKPDYVDPLTDSGNHAPEAENTIPLSPGNVPPSLSQVSSIELRIINNRLQGENRKPLDPRMI